MKTKNKTRKLSVILDDYNNILNDYKVSQTDDIKEQINVLQQEAAISVEKEKKDNKEAGLIMLFFLIIFIVIGIFFFLMNKENENLRSDNNAKTNIINKLQWTDSLFNQIMNVQYDSLETRSVSYRTKNGEIVKYNELVDENNKLEKERDILKRKLNLVQKNYDITFEETEKSIIIHAEQIDSALLLLPYYKDKLKYNPTEKTWTIILP